jgi:hypothetical protein
MPRSPLTWALCAASLLSLVGVADAKPKATPGRPGAVAENAPADAPDKQETLVEVSVLHGTREAREPDPRIGDMPELREGPFAKYPSFRLLSRSRLPLVKGGKRQLTLPNGRLLEARLADLLPDGSARLVASINRPGANDFLPLLEVKAKRGQSFIVAGQSYKRGILVLVFKVVK